MVQHALLAFKTHKIHKQTTLLNAEMSKIKIAIMKVTGYENDKNNILRQI